MLKNIPYMKTKTIISTTITLAILIVGTTLWGQESEIRLLDKATGDTISNTHYYYGNTHGVSTADGLISFTYSENESLFLSHLLYGKVTLDSNQVAKAINTGSILLTKTEQLLGLVTVISKPTNIMHTSKEITSCQDRLTHDAGAFIDQIPAISVVRKSGSYGLDPVMRGFRSDQLNIVMDGCVSASAACPNRMDPPISQIPVNMIEQVEIYKGPYALRFGNSFGGTINFKSFDPKFVDKSTAFGRITGSYESNGNVVRTEGAVGLRNSWANLEVFGSFSKGNDYIDGGGNEIPSEFQKTSVGSNLAFRINKRQKLVLSATNNMARDIDFPALPMDLTSDDTWMGSATYSVLFPDNKLSSWKTSLFASDVDHEMDNLIKELDPRTVNAITLATTKNMGGRTELKFQTDNSWLYTGLDFKKEEVDGTRTRNMIAGTMSGNTFYDNVWQDSYIQKTALFAEYHYTSANWHYTLAGRLEMNQAEAQNADSVFAMNYNEVTSSDINPSLSLGASKKLHNDMQLSFWLGRSQRSGGIAERFINFLPIGLDAYEMIGNPELKPEANHQMDVTLNWENPWSRVNASVFGSYITNFISSEILADVSPKMASSPGVRQFTNLDAALLFGAELIWSQQLFKGFDQTLSLAFTYGRDLENESALPEIPPMDMTYRVVASFFKDKIKPEASIRMVMEQDRVSELYGETKTPAFSLLNIGITYKPKEILSFSTGIQNVLDEKYYEHLSRNYKTDNTLPIYAPGRNIYVTGSVRF